MTRFASLAILLFLTVSEAQEYPSWCRRGAVRWTHGFVTWTPEHVRMVLDLGFNLVQSGYWHESTDEPPLPASRYFEAEEEVPLRWRVSAYRKAAAMGFRWQRYTDSHALNPEVLQRHPELEKCLVRLENGEPRFGYANPKRPEGCWSQELYGDYVLDILMRVRRRYGKTLETIFMDNASPRPCYCDACKAKFRDFSRAALGEEIPLEAALERNKYRAVWLMFMVNMGERFFTRMKRETGFLICPNFHFTPWHFAMIERGVPDLIFFEQGRDFPPFSKSTFYYKAAVALSGGRVVGVMLGLPDRIAEQRALKRGKYWETGHPMVTEAFYYPEEWSLALAEGAACDGCWIPSWNIREQKITLDDDPYHSTMREVLRRHNRFMMEHEGIYREASPMSNIAVLYSSTTALGKGGEYMRFVANQCEALVSAGFPYEVIGERDLTPDKLKRWAVVVLPACSWLPGEKCKALSEYLRAGGGLLLIGNVAESDAYGLPHRKALPAEFAAADESIEAAEERRAEVPPEQLPVAEATSRAKSALTNAGKRETWEAGRLWRVASLDALEIRRVKSAVEWLAQRNIAVKLDAPPQLFANAMQTSHYRTVHLVNYNFNYAEEQTTDPSVRYDDGTSEARTYLSRTTSRVRKILEVPNPQEFTEAYLQFKGGTWGGKQNTVHIIFNGREMTLKSSYFHGMRWHEVKLEPPRVQRVNTIEIFLSGKTDTRVNYLNIAIDTDAAGGRSFWSNDSGKTWTRDDLSPDAGEQRGEFIIRLSPVSRRKIHKPEDFEGKLTVKPARNITVAIADELCRGRNATLLTREREPIEIKPRRVGARWEYLIPEVKIYAVLRLPR